MSAVQYTPRDVGAVIQDIVAQGHNPASTVRIMYEHLSEISNGTYGDGLQHASHPFGVLLESCAAMTASGIMKSIINGKASNLTLAATNKDLYRFMNDQDVMGIMAKPSLGVFQVLINHDQLLIEMVDDPIEDYRQVTIPAGTQVGIAGYSFLIEKDVHIRLYPNGILEVSTTAHRSTLVEAPFISDIVTSYIVRDTTGVNWLTFDLPLRNLQINTSHHDANRSELFDIMVDYNNFYHHAKVYYELADGSWVELPVFYHHDATVQETPCVVVEILENQVRFMIPPIYTYDGLVNGRIQVDIYETAGDVRLHLADYNRSSFTYEIESTLETVATLYTNPFKHITLQFLSIDTTEQGRDALGFNAIKKLLVNNATGPNKTPLTHKQVEAYLNNRKYGLLSDADSLTIRSFFAARSIPDVLYNEYLRTPANISLETIDVDLEELSGQEQFYAHDHRLTIPPEVLYEFVNGQTKIISKEDRDALLGLTKQDLIIQTSARQFMYSPFYYVVDTTTDTTELRPYRLDDPLSFRINHVTHNTTTNLTVFTLQHTLTKVATGYKLTLNTIGDGEYGNLALSDVHCHLRFKTAHGYYLYLAGTAVGADDNGQKVFEVLIDTDYDIDNQHRLYITNGINAGIVRENASMGLIQEVEIYYTTTVAAPTYVKSLEDDDISRLMVPDDSIVITKETLQLKLGVFLEHLWRRVKGFPVLYEVLRHKTSKYHHYKSNIYDVSPTTGAIFEFLPGCGGIDYKLIARKGQVIRDAQGRAIFEHRVGDVVLDSQGKPALISVNKYKYYMALTMVEGVFYFATQDSALQHKTDVSDYITEWVDEMKTVQKSLLANHKVYYHPGSTIKSIPVHIEDGKSMYVNGQQSLTVTVHVRQDVYTNDGAKDELSRRTVEIIKVWIGQPTLAISDLIESLRDAYGKTVVNVEVSGLGGDANLRVLTVANSTDRLSLRKKLFSKSDKLIVTEDITTKFSLVR